MSDPKRLGEEAWQAHNGGRVGDAIKLFQQIIAEYPNAPAAADAREYLAAANTQLVRVVDIDIEFGSMVWLFIKAAIAVIPAAIILFLIGTIAVMVLGGVIGGVGGLFR